MTTTTPITAEEQVILMPRTNLRESPFNSRKTYSSASLNEMAQSMMPPAGRIHSPLVVRSLYQADIEQTHEIVFGHRRFRAAGLAGLDKVPVIIREMSEEEARIVQLIENAQREDVTALEEADSLRELRHDCGISIEDLMKRTGMSRSYVYGRLKLAQAAPEVRKAITEQGLSPETAQAIARRPHHDQQRKALKELRQGYMESPERPYVWLSTRDAEAKLMRLFSTMLTEAPFSLDDASLAERAGACTGCPQRAGNDPDLSSLDPMTCMDAGCYESKAAEHERRRIAALRETGHTVLTGDEAKAVRPSSYNDPVGMIPIDEEAYTIPGDHETDEDAEAEEVTFAQALAKMGDAAPKLTYIASPVNGKLTGYLTTEQANAVLEASGVQDRIAPPKTDAERRLSHKEFEAARYADWTPQERLTKDVETWRLVRRQVIIALATQPRSTDELRLLLLRDYELSSDVPGLPLEALGIQARMDAAQQASEDPADFDPHGWYLEWIDTATADELGALLSAMAVDDEIGSYASSREAAAKKVALALRYGVDLAEFLPKPEQIDIEPEAATAAAAAKLVPAWPSPTPATDARVAAKVQQASSTKNPVKYRDPATGMTWSGRGLQPKWLKVALADGKRLEDFATDKPEPDAAQLALLGGQEEEAREVSA